MASRKSGVSCVTDANFLPVIRREAANFPPGPTNTKVAPPMIHPALRLEPFTSGARKRDRTWNSANIGTRLPAAIVTGVGAGCQEPCSPRARASRIRVVGSGPRVGWSPAGNCCELAPVVGRSCCDVARVVGSVSVAEVGCVRQA